MAKQVLNRRARSRAAVNRKSPSGKSNRSRSKENGVIADSTQLDGGKLNGHRLNGNKLNGHALNGSRLNGHTLNGDRPNGHKLNGQTQRQEKPLLPKDLPTPLSKTGRGQSVIVAALRSQAALVEPAAPSCSALIEQDGRLVKRCLSGDVAAWSEIYQAHHDLLLVLIRRFLNRASRDANLVEEIAARVWYALIKNDFELLARFDVSRGCRLSTYLAVVAKNETRVLFRSERRRKTREQLASRPDVTSAPPVVESSQLGADEDFLVSLSQAERVFFQDVLMAPASEREQAEQGYSAENNWQLRRRVRKKLEQYISESDS